MFLNIYTWCLASNIFSFMKFNFTDWICQNFIPFRLQVSVVSVVYSQSELLQKEVFLVEMVDSISMSKEPMSHLKAVYFLRPTSDNIRHMRHQLAKPRFGEYHLCKFSSVLCGDIIWFTFEIVLKQFKASCL